MELTQKFWERTYKDNIGKMIGVCYRYVANHQIAEDLAHDAFITAIDKSAGYKGTGNFEAWIRKIAVNSALQFLRKQKSNVYFDEWQFHDESIHESINDDNEINVISKTDFTREELTDAINSLPEHHKLVFNLYVIDRHSHKQIGELLNISPGTSKSHLARARKKIQKALYNKALAGQNKQERKKSFLLILFTCKSKYIDRLYRHKFDEFNIQPKINHVFKAINPNATLPVFWVRHVIKYFVITLISFGIIAVLYFSARNRSFTPNYNKENNHTLSDPVYRNNRDVRKEDILPGRDTVKIISPVVIKKKTIIRHRSIFVRDTIMVIDTSYAQ